jgi:hypothetical protein
MTITDGGDWHCGGKMDKKVEGFIDAIILVDNQVFEKLIE